MKKQKHKPNEQTPLFNKNDGKKKKAQYRKHIHWHSCARPNPTRHIIIIIRRIDSVKILFENIVTNGSFFQESPFRTRAYYTLRFYFKREIKNVYTIFFCVRSC